MISKFSVKRPYTVFVVVIAVIVIGVVAMMRSTMDLLPDMNLPYVLIITTDMGASPEAVEKNVTAPLEASLATTSNLKNIQSMSYNSYSTIILEYEQNANMDATMIEIQQSIDQIKGTFDDGIGTPIAMQLNPDMLPVMVAAVNVDDMNSIQLSDYVDSDILPQLESIEGVASVSSTGGITETIKVTMNQDKIDDLNEKIMADIESEFDDAKEELADAKEEVEDGQDAVDEGKETLADTIGENTANLQATQIELYQTADDLETQKDTYQDTYDTLGDTIDTLNTTYDGAVTIVDAIAQLDTAIEGLETAISTAEAAMEAATAAASSGAGTDASMATQTDASSTSDGSGADASSGYSSEYSIDALQTQLDSLKSQKSTLETQLNTINSSIAANGSSMADYGITLNTYEDIPAAVATLETTRATIAEGITTIEDAIEDVESGKTTTKEALETLSSTGITQSINLAETASTLSNSLSTIESAEDTLEDTMESTMDAADLNNVLSLDTLNNLLIAQNFDMPAGYASGDGGQYLVKVGDAVPDAETLADTVLIDLKMDSVGEIKLSDVADVEEVNDSQEVYAKLNGSPGILISFEKQTGYSTGEVTDSILEKFESLKKTEDESPDFAVLMNQGVYIDIIAKSIVQNILLGAALAIIVLLVFLKDFRPTVIIACAIPISLIFAVVLMYFTSISFNIISLSGLTLGIGMLVDNSIVVIENIYRIRKEGESIKKAAVYGASQVAGAITASTLTTICVFLPIVFTDGLTRQLFVDMGLTIAYTLTASLLVALTLVPAMAQGLLRNSKSAEEDKSGKLMNGYGNFIGKILKFKPLVFLVVILLLAASVFLSLSRGTQFMPEMQSDQVTVNLAVPDDVEMSFEEITAESDKLVERILEIDDVETVGAMMGNGSTLGALSGDSGSGVSMYILLDENTKLSNSEITKMIEERAEDLTCEATVSASMMDMDLLTGSGISVMIKGRDIQILQKLAAESAAAIESVKGTTDVDDGLEDMTKTFEISVDKSKAADYGLTVAQVYTSVAAKLASTTSTTTVEAALKDFDVFVQTDEQSEITIDDLKKMTLEYTDTSDNNETKEVKLSKIATFTEGEELSSVQRDNQNRYISVSASLEDGYNIGLVGNQVQAELNKIDVPEGYSVTLRGENETINDAMHQLMLMLLLAVVLIYLIMVAQFQSLKSPFIIMFTIPLAFTGGFLLLYVTGMSVSVIAMIGFVMLSGIIVNNGIVLVDYINQLRREGMSKHDAIVMSSKTRLRPVLMTAITTIISMSTMALGFGKGTELSQPMAIVVVGGLVYGTLLTLVVVPCLYDAFNKERDMTEEEI